MSINLKIENLNSLNPRSNSGNIEIMAVDGYGNVTSINLFDLTSFMAEQYRHDMPETDLVNFRNEIEVRLSAAVSEVKKEFGARLDEASIELKKRHELRLEDFDKESIAKVEQTKKTLDEMMRTLNRSFEQFSGEMNAKIDEIKENMWAQFSEV